MKTTIYCGDIAMGTVSLEDGKLTIDGDDAFRASMLEIANIYPTQEAFYLDLPSRMDGYVHAKREQDEPDVGLDYGHLNDIDDYIASTQDDLEIALGEVVAAARAEVIEAIPGLSEEKIGGLVIKSMGRVTGIIGKAMRSVMNAGMLHAHKETGMSTYAATDRKRAEDYLRSKAVTVSGAVTESLTSAVKQALLTGIRGGDSEETIMQRVSAVFDAFMIEDATIRGRLRTIVRTNINDAYNQGRIANAMTGGAAGMRYVAILDDRTTECCQHLHNKVFRMDDPDIHALAPPNHYNCRSMLMPVHSARGGRWITEEDKARARALATPGFV